MAVELESPRSRRSLIRGGLAAVAGLALGLFGRARPAEALAGGPVLMGTPNDAGTSNTTLTTSSTGTAFQVNQNGAGTALRGVAGNGIAGFFTSANGSGISGVVAANSKYGVYGANDAATSGTGAAIRANGQMNVGLAASSSARQGIRATSPVDLYEESLWSAVRGQGGIGVLGLSQSTVGIAVAGLAVATSGETHAVEGTCSSPDGYALYGYGNAYVLGDLTVTGAVSKASGTFKIDHPLDPANKYLCHSFVESPDMLNVYSGTATLDKAGEATVELPDWFDALNGDTRIQLTPVARFSELFVKAKIDRGRFTIAGGVADQEVYWQVTGVRRDAYAAAHPMPVEQLKPERERGLYLHPLEHGQPEGKGIEAARRRSRRLDGEALAQIRPQDR